MFRNMFFFLLFSFSYAQASSRQPELVFRPQRPLEACLYIQQLIDLLPWLEENGYKAVLPFHDGELEEEFVSKIYDVSLFNLSLSHLQGSELLIRKALERLLELEKNWGFKLMERYEVILTLYGTGGDCNAKTGQIILFTTEQGSFKRQTGYEVLLHEIVHIGIDEPLVKKYKLTHWEKERIVDLICSQYLKEILPKYKLQQKGDVRIDAFINVYSIEKNLPEAIERFVRTFPR